jgi:hypothetical protein
LPLLLSLPLSLPLDLARSLLYILNPELLTAPRADRSFAVAFSTCIL